MSDMTGAVAQQLEAQATRAGIAAAQQGIKTTVAMSGAGTRVSAHVAQRAAGGTIRALVAMIEAARQVGANKRDEGQVGLKQFTRLTDGKREILPIDEREVAREFARELRKHGVTFAIERHKDGSRTFHVEGKDAAVVEHALAQASARVDDRIRSEAEKRERGEQTSKFGVEGERPDPQEQETVQKAAEDAETTLATEGARDLPEQVDMTQAEVVMVLDHREQTALAQALTGPPHREALAEQIQSEAQVVLNRDNVATLSTVIAEQGWTTEHGEMGWVAGTVAQQHDRLTPTVDNPWLTVEAAPSTDAPVRSGDSNPFAPGEWDGHEPQAEAQTPVRTTEQPVAQEPPVKQETRTETDRAPQAGNEHDRQLSPRDATREKVAKQIDTKSEAIKNERGVGQTKTRATPRSPKMKR